MNPVYIYKVEQIHAVGGIADGDSHQPRSALAFSHRIRPIAGGPRSPRHQLPQMGLRRAAEIGETGAGARAPKQGPPNPRGPSRGALPPTADCRGARTMLTKKEAGLKRGS